MRFDVTRRMILSGCRNSGNDCPIHTSIVEGLGERLAGWAVTVTESVARFYPVPLIGLSQFRIDLPEIVTDNIRRFDAIGEMDAFAFDLDDAVLARLDGQREVSRAR